MISSGIQQSPSMSLSVSCDRTFLKGRSEFYFHCFPLSIHVYGMIHRGVKIHGKSSKVAVRISGEDPGFHRRGFDSRTFEGGPL